MIIDVCKFSKCVLEFLEETASASFRSAQQIVQIQVNCTDCSDAERLAHTNPEIMYSSSEGL